MHVKRKQKYVDIASKFETPCDSVSPNGKRCCYSPGHIERGRPGYHCDAHGLEAWSSVQAATTGPVSP